MKDLREKLGIKSRAVIVKKQSPPQRPSKSPTGKIKSALGGLNFRL